MRPTSEIHEQIGLAGDQIVQGSTNVPGMTYEEGVDYALRWALGESDDLPIDPDEFA
jgi:hypothetical protein